MDAVMDSEINGQDLVGARPKNGQHAHVYADGPR